MDAFPSRGSAAVFAAKVALLRLRRGVREFGAGPRRHQRGPASPDAAVVAESRTPLWSDTRQAEREYQLGKVQNLRRAARMLDGVVIPAGQTFSFWRQVGRATRRRGFVDGRMLQGGCMVPAVGGGLCQVSNALYDVALQAGCTIVERHAHSRLVPGAPSGRDATVAWNYVDLRFRPGTALRLHVRLTADELVVRLHGPGRQAAAAPDILEDDGRAAARSCGTCAEVACFRHEHALSGPPGEQAFLVDEAWPEFLAHVATARGSGARLGAPFPAALGRFTRGTWPTPGFGQVVTTPLPALARSFGVRRAPDGAARRRAEMDGTARIAASLAQVLAPEIMHPWIAQSFLPHLWRDGHLGGRRFSVLLTRPPMHVLHARLDAAFAAHPDRATLADFRADPDLVQWEAEALAAAEAVATPHPDVAALFPGRAVRLPWRRPEAPAIRRAAAPRCIAFPGPTLARKGAFEVRDAARALDLEVLLLGSELEGDGFWRGVRVRHPDPASGHAWLGEVTAVVQPALVEEQPRRLLLARAAGVPVIATPACGLDGPGVTLVAPLDGAGLVEALRRVLGEEAGQAVEATSPGMPSLSR